MILEGKHALITGGSRGIGLAVARAFVKQGAAVLLAARNQTELESAKSGFGSQSDKIFIHRADASRPKDVKSIFKTIADLWQNKLDIAINAAGIYGPKGLLEDTDEEEWLRTITINLFGTMLVTRAALPLMKNNHSGVIINFAGGGEGAFPRFSAYAASKGAVVRFTETIAAEVKDFGIRVNAIAPGAVNTKLLEEVLAVGPEKVGEEFYQRSLEQKESGGVAPEKAAELCLFLASEKSAGLTGRVLSAIWDNWSEIPKHLTEINESDIYTWRRIKPKDRGYDW